MSELWDLIVTMDDATSKHYSMFFVEEEGTQSSFQGVYEVIDKHGLFASFYTDRGSHYWYTPEAGKKVDKENLTQFGRAMRQLGIEMIPAYSPEARGRSERAFRTNQDRLVKELALAGITDMKQANAYIRDIYMPAFNDEFAVSPEEYIPRLKTVFQYTMPFFIIVNFSGGIFTNSGMLAARSGGVNQSRRTGTDSRPSLLR